MATLPKKLTELESLPPPPQGVQGVSFDAISKLPPPPQQGQGMTLEQINAQKPSRTLGSRIVGAAKMAGGAIKGVGNFLTTSERAFGKDIASGIGGNIYAKQIDEANQKLADADLNNIKTFIDIKKKRTAEGKDTDHINELIKNYKTTKGVSLNELFPSLDKTNLQVLGDAGGVLADVLSFGTYGNAAKGAKTGSLLVKGGGVAEKVATNFAIPTSQKIITPTVKVAQQALLPTLRNIGKQTAKQTVKGASIGYAGDVIQNAKEGDTGKDLFKPGFGTAFGTAVPLAIGSIKAVGAVTKALAPRIINSLVKPKTADFAYGKDPGRTVSEMGITGNSLDEFADNIKTARDQVGEEIGNVYKNPKNIGAVVDVSDEISKIDRAIAEAAKGGKNNQTIVDQLKNVKDALIFEHVLDEKTGKIIKAGNATTDDAIARHFATAKQLVTDPDMAAQFNTKEGLQELLTRTKVNIVDGLKGQGVTDVAEAINKIDVAKLNSLDDLIGKVSKLDTSVAEDLSKFGTQSAFGFKRRVAEATQFTGRASDDKKVNSVLKDIYGGVTEKLNTVVEKNNPEIRKLNEKYGDLVSAQIATKNRDMIVKRAALVSLPVKVGTATALITAITTGGAVIPTLLAGATAGVVDKAFESPAVKTRVAAWLAKESQGVIAELLEKNPSIGPILLKQFPLMASRLGKDQTVDQ